MRNLIRCFVPAMALVAVAWHASIAPAEEESVDFRGDVFPILQAHCVGCHTTDDDSGGLNMESFQTLAGGGEHGPAFTAGVPDSSRMYRMAAGTLEPRMPPEGEQPLDESQLAVLKSWIEAGAKGPDGDAPPPMLHTPDLPAASAEQLPLTAVAISSQGDRVALGQYQQIEIRNAACSDVLQTIPHADGKVNALAFDRSGRRLLVAGGVTGLRGRAVLYDLDSGKVLQSFEGDRDVLYTAVFSPDESKVATAGYDRDVMVWDAASGQQLVTMEGHNGAVFRVAFSPDGQLLASASADETVKVWSVESGERLDTLPQPQAEVLDVAFTSDGEQIVAASADNRFRVWKVVSRKTPKINPLRVTRFADETPLTRLALTPGGEHLLVLSQAGNVKSFDTSRWQPTGTLKSLGEAASDLSVFPEAEEALVTLMNGGLERLSLASLATSAQTARANKEAEVEPIYVQLDLPQPVSESTYRQQASESPLALDKEGQLTFLDQSVAAGRRGFIVDGQIAAADESSGKGETDWYALEVERGEVWMIDAAAADNSPLDTVVEVCDPSTGQPFVAARLQAVRDSYFTFRGKNSTQSSDFRMFAWEEMELDDYLYAAGEVTRLWMYPRGPDSGFNVYPGSGNRWTYFNTTPVTHALGEPAYIVRPLAPGQPRIANGLPVFEIPMINDDDPTQRAGTDSRLIFTAPVEGTVLVSLRDSRGFGGDDLRYRLTARPAEPDFQPSVQAIGKPIPPGAGRELTLRAARLDGYQGPIRFDISGLPEGLHVTSPIWIEAGQDQAVATVWADQDAKVAGDVTPSPLQVTATATIAGRKVQHRVEQAGTVQLGDKPPLQVLVQPADRNVPADESWTLQIRPGETVRARVQVKRNTHQGEVALGKETAGRNTHHGVFVDNIGLSGLLIVKGADEREFFLTAAPIVQPGKRAFFLTAGLDGAITSRPITLEVVE